MTTRIKIIAVVICLYFTAHAAAAERQLIYTYIGPVAGGGLSNIRYSDWFQNKFPEQETKKIFGYFFHIGFTTCLISRVAKNLDFLGDFSIQYMHNQNEKPLDHLYYTISGKIGWSFADFVTPALGIGLFFETPPSNRKYSSGGGFRVPLAVYFNTTYDTKLFVEGSAMYGFIGVGEKSTKFSYGVNLGFIFRVGRI